MIKYMYICHHPRQNGNCTRDYASIQRGLRSINKKCIFRNQSKYKQYVSLRDTNDEQLVRCFPANNRRKLNTCISIPYTEIEEAHENSIIRAMEQWSLGTKIISGRENTNRQRYRQYHYSCNRLLSKPGHSSYGTGSTGWYLLSFANMNILLMYCR